MAWNNSRFKRTRSNFQCPRFMHQKCLGPKTCFMRVKMEDTVPLPQVANRPYVCEIYLCTGISGTRQASKIGAISPGWQPCLSPATVTILTCSCRGNSSVTECRKRYRTKRSQVIHVQHIIFQPSYIFLSNKDGDLPQKVWQLCTQDLCWLRSQDPQASLFHTIFMEPMGGYRDRSKRAFRFKNFSNFNLVTNSQSTPAFSLLLKSLWF